MGSYVPRTLEEKETMLADLDLRSFDDFFVAVPKSIRLNTLNIPSGVSEMETRNILESVADKNKIFKSIFRGAGSYKHYIPSIVKSITSKEEFVTSYTPYQAEISQGLLQAIFEFQTMICEITDMDASNASVYDGATAAAEAISMCSERKRNIAIVSGSSNPITIEAIKTYCFGSDLELIILPAKNGKTDFELLEKSLTSEISCVYIEQVNYFGIIEEAEKIGELVNKSGAKFIMGVNPISATILKSPRECCAHIVVGEGQPLGMPLSFGGPYLGFMCCLESMIRKLPGRIVGETVDNKGRRAFVLTLQAREQHIRREKASSNICSNQALCALTASVYMTVMGPSGIKDVATSCLSKAHYFAEKISEIKGFELKFESEFFNEFVTNCPIDKNHLLKKLEDNNILGGLPLEDGILWCVTEMNSKEEIDFLIKIIKEAF